MTRTNGETVTRWSTRAVENVLAPEARMIRASERLRVLEEIVTLAGDMDGLRELVENAGGDPEGKTSLSRARSLLRELAAIGGPLDAATTVTAPQLSEADRD